MPKTIFHRSNGSKFTMTVQPALILGIILVLVLTACGDQNAIVTSQAVAAVGGQLSSSGSAPNRGQATPSVAPSKATPKPAATVAKVPAGTIHICSLLTKDEVAASIGGTGVEVDAARDTLGEFGGASCDYTSSSGGLSVQVSITGESQADFENNSKNLNAQAVPGVGDASFFLVGLSTLKGKLVVLVVQTPTKGVETLTGLTQKILTAWEKTGRADDLKVSVLANKDNEVTASNLPIYPGAVRVKDDSTIGPRIATFTSTDSYAAIVSWYKKRVADKTWTGNVVFEPAADYTIISAGKATAETSSQLTVSIEGPKKAGRGAGSDAKGNPIILNPNATLIIMTLV